MTVKQNYALDKPCGNVNPSFKKEAKGMNPSHVCKLTDDQARESFERIRWPHGAVCVHCGGTNHVGKLKGKAHRVGVYKCYDCGEQFTATVGTILEDTHLPIRLWLMAFAILCSSKRGVSALQLQRQLRIGSYRSAWHMAHRIRHAMSQEPMAGLLKGTVEVDETYVGGKPRKGTGARERGRGMKKVPVVPLVERNGRVRSRTVERVDATNPKDTIRKNVDRSAPIRREDSNLQVPLERQRIPGPPRLANFATPA